MVLWPDEGGRARTPEHRAVFSKKQEKQPCSRLRIWLLPLIPQASLACLGFPAPQLAYSSDGCGRNTVDPVCLLLTVLKAGEFNVMVLAGSVLGKGPLPSLKKGCHPAVCSPDLFVQVYVEREREGEEGREREHTLVSLLLLIKRLIPL